MIVSLFFFMFFLIHLSKAANPGLPARRNELRSHSTNLEKDLEELQTKTVVALPSPDIRNQYLRGDESGLNVRGPPGPPGPAENSWGFPEERNVGDDANQLYVRGPYGPRIGTDVWGFPGERNVGDDAYERDDLDLVSSSFGPGKDNWWRTVCAHRTRYTYHNVFYLIGSELNMRGGGSSTPELGLIAPQGSRTTRSKSIKNSRSGVEILKTEEQKPSLLFLLFHKVHAFCSSPSDSARPSQHHACT
ncbi:hypothetical protein HOLleu_35501 [Holothuria leucospilota]|uniref:Uncharacterized protein n=1 Tax=Holothuria leucospilota TaxID=206669 RepID=A0A9Q1BHD9_HOLLE|nr:hypothetical protein HOLleu_35501 [Holothuria leucospilota]